MIEISHKQAQRLIRENRDGRKLPEERWAMLQAHLEQCDDCRSYADRLASIERELTRTLRDRWSLSQQDAKEHPGFGADVSHFRQVRAERRRMLLHGLLGLGAALLLVLYTYIQWLSPPAPALTPIPTPSLALVQPSLLGARFQGVIAYTAVVDDPAGPNAEIFLLNRGGPAGQGEMELTNLTQDPAQDIEPAWSPDGAWLAFLSNRGAVEDRPGKFELYVISVAGTRLTRLTNRPDVDWSGPLSWSADGRFIALTGRRRGIDQSFVFLVPVNGIWQGQSGARTLAFTRGASGPLAFSPYANLLAYAISDPERSIMVYDLVSMRFIPVGSDQALRLPVQERMQSFFDWSPDGRRLAYVESGLDEKDGEGNSSGAESPTALKISADLFPGANVPSQLLYKAGNTRLRSVTWLPDTSRLVLAYLAEGQPNCWTIHLLTAGGDARPREVEELCVESTLKRASWSSDARWLVVAARLPDGSGAGYYTVQIPADLALQHPAPFEWLSETMAISDMEGEADSFFPPQVQPSNQEVTTAIRIDPQPDEEEQAGGSPAVPDARSGGRLLFSVLTGGSTSVHTANPDLSSRVDFRLPGSTFNCPTFSPDGSQIAFLADPSSLQAPASSNVPASFELFLMDASGTNRHQLTDGVSTKSPYSLEYGCPQWSPDGTRLAVPMHSPSTAALGIYYVDGSLPAYIPVNFADLSYMTGPVWSPDGQRVVLVSPSSWESPLRIFEVDLSKDPPQEHVLFETSGIDQVFGLVFSPARTYGIQGPSIAFIGAVFGGSSTRLNLYSMRWDGNNFHRLAVLPDSEFQAWVGSSGLAWLPDGSINFSIRHGTAARYKTDLWRFDPGSGERKRLAHLEDLLIDAAWSPDARWFIYSSDAGLFALDIRAAQRGEARPALLTDELVYDLDWR